MLEEHNDHNRWKVLGRKTIHTSRWLNLHQDRVQLPDGSIIEEHHVVDYPNPAVAVVPLNQTGQIMMIEHDRFITQKRGWEIPGGGVEPGENWEAAARRELLEESGCSGGNLIHLTNYHPSTGSSNQLFVVYLAQGVEQTAPIADTNEVIRARWFSVTEVRSLIDQNVIADGFSLMALLLAFYKGFL